MGKLKTLKPRLQSLKPRLSTLTDTAVDRNRGKTAARGYGGRWQRERKRFLEQHPLCIKCHAEGLVTLATVVDHKVPHKGDPDLMWNHDNWQPLCARHHSRDKQRAERTLR